MPPAGSSAIDKYFGRMNGPTASSYVKGICGEEMEFYLIIEDGVITEVKYYTQGCEATRACVEFVASLADKNTIKRALLISAGQVIDRLAGTLPVEHLHCSILAITALYKAVADYLLKV